MDIDAHMQRDEDITPERLKVLLEEPGRSQAGLARRLRIDTSAVNRMVNGKREIKAREVGIIRQYLKDTAAPEHGGPSKPRRVLIDELTTTTYGVFTTFAMGKSGSIEQILATGFLAILANIKIGASPRLAGSFDEETDDEDQFWDYMEKYPRALIALGAGLGLYDRFDVGMMIAAFKLALTVTARDNIPFDERPEVEGLLADLFPARKSPPKPQDQDFKPQLAGVLSHLAMVAAGKREEVISELRNVASRHAGDGDDEAEV